MNDLSRWLKALADPLRLRLIWLLWDGQEHCVCQLVNALAVPQSTVSRHLRILRDTGLVTGRREGTWMFYSLLPQDETRQAIMAAVREALAAQPWAAALRRVCHTSQEECQP